MKKRPAININVVALVLALGWLVLVSLTLTQQTDDYKQYWQAARDLLQYGDPYASTPDWRLGVQQPATSGTASAITYPYPPLLAYIIQPLGLLSHSAGQRIWFGINTIALFGLIALCIDLSRSVLARRYWGVVVLGMVLAPPTRLSLQLGQVSILIALMLVLSLVLARRSPAGSGLLLALASLIKLYPAFLGLLYLFRRWYRAIGWGIAAGVVLVAVSVLVYGVTPYINYLEKVLLSGYYPYAAEFNISIVGFWNRLLSASRYAVPLLDSPGTARVLSLLSGLGVLGICGWQAGKPPDEPGAVLQFGIWLCGMLFLSPVNGYYNLVLLLLPLLSVLYYLEQHADRRLRTWLMIGTALVCIPPGWSKAVGSLYNAVHTGWGLLLLTPAIYGLAIYLGLLVFTVRQRTAQAGE